MALADKWGKPLYEVMPDRFPWGRLTPIELNLWAMFHEERKAERERKKR
jgi:hypothetical protein